MLKHQNKSNLILIQKSRLKQIFSKNDNTWKIIIFDQFNHDIISSIYKMKDFRQNNITLYFNIKQYREQLHGVTAIYLLKPTVQNVQLILKDFQNDLYSSTIIHFSSQPPVHLLSSFAKNLVKKKPSALSRVSKVQYSNVGFQCVDNKMAILPQNTQIINFLLTFKCQPIFVHSSKDQQQVNFIKQRLQGSYIKNFDSLSEKDIIENKNYVLVFFFNRQLDMFPVFAHGITYAGLIQDIWKFSKNGVQIFQNKQQESKNHGVLLDLNDQIWIQRKNMHTNQMDLQKQFNKIKNKMLALNNKIDQLSELSQKNKKIEWHLSNVQVLIRQAKKRALNQYHSVQEQLYTKKQLNGQNKKCFIQLLKTSQNIQDRCRLMLAYISCVQNLQRNQVQQLQSHFQDIKKNNKYNQMKLRRLKQQAPSSDSINQGSKYLKKFAKGIWKNLVVSSQKKYLLVKYLQKIQQFDQKSLSDMGLKITTLKKIPHDFTIEKTVAYVTGGVCFNEYANLAQYNPKIYYTGDKIINYRQFF